MARKERMRLTGDRHASHTEYTRMLAEHGAFGVASLGLLLFIWMRAYRNARPVKSKVLVVAAIAFASGFMVVSATRLVLPSFMIALACVRLETPASRVNIRPALVRRSPALAVPIPTTAV